MNLSKKERSMLSRSVEAARLSTCWQQHGAVIEDHGKVLAVGCNRYRNDPDNVDDPKRQGSYHAEVAALRSYQGSLKGATIYVARLSRSGILFSRPCPDCRDAIVEAGIRKAVYTGDNGSAIVEFYRED